MIQTKFWKDYLCAYISEFPTYLIHELSHWLAAVFFWLLGFNGFPTIVIERWFSIKEYEPGSTTSKGFHMYNTYYDKYDYKEIELMIVIAPAIVTIILFIMSPWWLNIYWLCGINQLWLSAGDYNDIYKLLKPEEND